MPKRTRQPNLPHFASPVPNQQNRMHEDAATWAKRADGIQHIDDKSTWAHPKHWLARLDSPSGNTSIAANRYDHLVQTSSHTKIQKWGNLRTSQHTSRNEVWFIYTNTHIKHKKPRRITGRWYERKCSFLRPWEWNQVVWNCVVLPNRELYTFEIEGG